MNPDIHRLLDEAFRGVEMTPDAQDLKEEVRANLVARAEELEASGVAPAVAAQRAITELGDVQALLEATVPTPAPGAGAPAPRGNPWSVDAMARHRVRPKPGFVVRIVVASIVGAAGLVVATLGAFGVAAAPSGIAILAAGLTALAAAWIVGDALQQETSQHHPVPRRRAFAYAGATFVTLAGLGLGAFALLGILPMGVVLAGGVALGFGIALFAWLGATQTNRTKAWVRQSHADLPPNRFEDEPETAARFGIYTAVIWIVTFAVMAVLVFTVGWWWAILAFVGGMALMMLVLARMMFGARKDA